MTLSQSDSSELGEIMEGTTPDALIDQEQPVVLAL
jgi:hypothetical protein